MPPNDPTIDGRDIALVISDVDGTLVTHDKILTPRAIAAVKALGAAGIGFTVTSSRPPRGLKMLVEPLDLRLPIGGFNGGGLVSPDFQVIRRLALTPETAGAALALIFSHGLDAWVYDETEWFVRDVNEPHVAHEIVTLGFAPTVVASFDDHLDRVGKMVAIGDDPAAVTRCNAALIAALGDSASATRSQTFFIDVTNPGANKGGMVDAMSSLLAIPPSKIATIGDMENDVLMFARSGLSVAMGNATPEVKARASRVTASNEQEGFAMAIEQILRERDGKPR